MKGKKVREKLRYYFGVNRIEVCRQTFIDTLDITHGLLQSVNKRKSESGDVALSKQGKREWAYKTYYLNSFTSYLNNYD